ncbi:MAG: hypothetical protein AAF919_02095 [Pseudomonadota bacterium]
MATYGVGILLDWRIVTLAADRLGQFAGWWPFWLALVAGLLLCRRYPVPLLALIATLFVYLCERILIMGWSSRAWIDDVPYGLIVLAANGFLFLLILDLGRLALDLVRPIPDPDDGVRDNG